MAVPVLTRHPTENCACNSSFGTRWRCQSEQHGDGSGRQRQDEAQLGVAPPVRVKDFAKHDRVPLRVDLLMTHRKPTNR